MTGTWTGYAESDRPEIDSEVQTLEKQGGQAWQRSHVLDSSSVANKLYF